MRLQYKHVAILLDRMILAERALLDVSATVPEPGGLNLKNKETYPGPGSTLIHVSLFVETSAGTVHKFPQ